VRAQSPEKLQARLRDTAGAVERERLRLADAERRSRDLQTRLDAVAKARALLRPPQDPCTGRPVGSAALGLASSAWPRAPGLRAGKPAAQLAAPRTLAGPGAGTLSSGRLRAGAQ
jgi:hypothetical protein